MEISDLGFLLSLMTSDLTATIAGADPDPDPKWVRVEETMGLGRRSLWVDPRNGDAQFMFSEADLLAVVVFNTGRG